MTTARSSGEGQRSLIQAWRREGEDASKVSDRLRRRRKEVVETHDHDRTSSVVEPEDVETKQDDGE